MATNNAVNVGLSGSTGTGTFVGSTSPTLVSPLLGTPTSGTLTNCTGLPIAGTTGYGTGVATALAANVTGTGGISLTTSPTFVTPILGAATATSVAFSPTTGGIIGTTTNDSVTAGSVGELITNSVSVSTPIALSTNTATDVCTISLTAGDWDVFGLIGFFGNATTLVTIAEGWSSTTSASKPSQTYSSVLYGSTGVTISNIAPLSFVIPTIRVSVGTTTTVYLSAFCTFTVSTMGAYGTINARRRR